MANGMSTSLILAHIFAAVSLVIVIQAALATDDVKQSLANYGVYHSEPRNQIVHFFGVPAILWSGIIFLEHVPVPILGNMFQKYLPADFQLTYGLVSTIFYQIYYLQIDTFGGTSYAPVLYAMYISSVYMRRSDQKQCGGTSWAGTGRLMVFALGLHFLGWFLQIQLGHKMFEGSQPALFQGLGAAVTVAPLFAWYEGLWYAGINKELQNVTLQLVQEYTTELCAAGATMRACTGM